MAKTSVVLARVRKLTADTAKTLRSELEQIEREKTRLTAELEKAASQIRNTLEQLGHGSNGSTKAVTAKAPARKSRKRVRRSPEQLKAEASALMELIRSKGSDGISGPEIRKHNGRIGPDLKGFIEQYSGKKLKTTGVARSMLYFVN